MGKIPYKRNSGAYISLIQKACNFFRKSTKKQNLDSQNSKVNGRHSSNALAQISSKIKFQGSASGIHCSDFSVSNFRKPASDSGMYFTHKGPKNHNQDFQASASNNFNPRMISVFTVRQSQFNPRTISGFSSNSFPIFVQQLGCSHCAILPLSNKFNYAILPLCQWHLCFIFLSHTKGQARGHAP